ncbi:MAG: hypothetical protein R3C68_08260 [Myxococcota bacterium]
MLWKHPDWSMMYLVETNHLPIPLWVIAAAGSGFGPMLFFITRNLVCQSSTLGKRHICNSDFSWVLDRLTRQKQLGVLTSTADYNRSPSASFPELPQSQFGFVLVGALLALGLA